MTDIKTYTFDINDRAFKAIKNNTKRVEIRVTKLNGEFDYSLLKKFDLIDFINSNGEKITCKILKINWYKSIEELLTIEGTKYTLSSTDDFDEGVRSINSLMGIKKVLK